MKKINFLFSSTSPAHFFFSIPPFFLPYEAQSAQLLLGPAPPPNPPPSTLLPRGGTHPSGSPLTFHRLILPTMLSAAGRLPPLHPPPSLPLCSPSRLSGAVPLPLPSPPSSAGNGRLHRSPFNGRPPPMRHAPSPPCRPSLSPSSAFKACAQAPPRSSSHFRTSPSLSSLTQHRRRARSAAAVVVSPRRCLPVDFDRRQSFTVR